MIRMREIKSVWLAESVAENVGTHAGTSDFVSLGNTCVHTDARTQQWRRRLAVTVIQAAGLKGSHVARHHWADCPRVAEPRAP